MSKDFPEFSQKQWQRNFYLAKHPKDRLVFLKIFPSIPPSVKNYQHCHSLRATEKFGAPKDVQKFFPETIAEKFSFSEALQR
ncbi:hypothetical protein ACP6PL_14220 [Dapis sp. BLCC M126]|uniref:hypothetical protein n=1 Tax=Dapis sp. BLCC M126 TaxID=3400189 RepID=UPI003CF75291